MSEGCCRPTRRFDCPHGHAAVLREVSREALAPADPRLLVEWIEEVAPVCCPLCPEGAVLTAYRKHHAQVAEKEGG